ncbi:MAG: efflux RND transporter permease subunit [Planctomycetes bacterium]|nr:efflux RND transporter permease subunit [Planctomycetota bacterium]
MNLIRFCVDRPVAVAVGVLLVVIFGLLSLFQLPVQLTPDVDVPVLTVSTFWPGANPQEVEREIIDRQEDQLRSVRGLRKMTSTSKDNTGVVTLEFYRGVDKYQAQREINDKLGQVMGYPLEVEEPVVQLQNEEMNNIIAWLILYPGEGRDDDEVRKLRDFAEDFIKPYLDRVPGVAGVPVYGGFEREVQIRVDAGQLAARGITFRQLETALRQQNADISAGTRMQGKRDYAVRTAGQFESLDEIRNTVIASTAGGPVYVHDVAEVEQAYKDPEGFVRSNGQYVLAMPVRAEVGSNVVTVMADLKKAIARVNDEILKGRQLKLELVQVYDQTVYIQNAMDMVQSNIVYGSALVLGLLLAFLRSWRATAVLALTIPVSIIGTFVVIVLLGRTLNVISLAGIAFAVGDVVDSAYVVLENVFRHRQAGKSIRDAVLDGTKEVWGAVLASTLTTMAVFLPVIFIQEEAGQLFRDISIAEVAAVGLSMLVAVTVIPPLAVRLLERRRGGPRFAVDDQPLAGGQAAPTRDPVLRFAGLVARIVDGLNHHRVARIFVIFGMTIGSFVLARFLIPDSTYLPAGNQNLVFGFLLTPPGYNTDEFERMGRTVEQGIRRYWEAKPGSPEQAELDRQWIEQVNAMFAANQVPDLLNDKLSATERDRARREWLTPPPLINQFFFVSWAGGCFMGATSRDEARVKPLVRLLQTSGAAIPGTYPIFFQAQLFTFGGGNDAEVQIRGDDLDKVTAAAKAMQMACMMQFGGFPQPDPSNFDQGRPELRIVPDRERAGELGMTVRDIGYVVEACVDGALVGDYRVSGGDTIDIALYVKGQKDRATREIAQIPLYTPTGRIVPLEAAAQLIDTTALEQINRIERQRAVTLTVTPPESMALEAVIRRIRGTEEQNFKDGLVGELRKAEQIDPSITISLTGNADKLAAARNSLIGEWKGWTWQSLFNILSGKALLSVLVVYLLMCALYESWLYPFVIMFSVPLAVFGGFLGLSLCHWATLLTTDQPVQQLDVLTFLGFIMLSGLVVKNAILLVEQSLVYLRDHHMPIRMAVREAVRVRVRPVLMTSLTSIVGLMPLAILPGAGSELYRGLASVILGGMFVSTLGTLVLVPLVLSAVIEVRDRFMSPVPEGMDEAAEAEAI